jgi:hypothetical protein
VPVYAAGEESGRALAAGTSSTKRHGVHDLSDDALPDGLQRLTGVLARLTHDRAPIIPVKAREESAGWTAIPKVSPLIGRLAPKPPSGYLGARPMPHAGQQAAR